MAESDRIVLVTKEGDRVEVDARLTSLSNLIRTIIEDSGLTEEIPLDQVTKPILSLILSYCEHHNYTIPAEVKKPLPSPKFSEAVEDQWDVQFVQGLQDEALIELVLAANYMDCKPVLDLCCAFIASKFKGKDIADLRAEYGIVEEFTPDEEDKLKQENPWAMEGDEERLLKSRTAG